MVNHPASGFEVREYHQIALPSKIARNSRIPKTKSRKTKIIKVNSKIPRINSRILKTKSRKSRILKVNSRIPKDKI